jgi:hypothetical protein
MAKSEWVEVAIPSKYFRFSEPGQEIQGRVKSIDAGKYGKEVVLLLASGKTTTLTCSSAELRAWAEDVVAVGEQWRIVFTSQADGKNGQQGMKRFKFLRLGAAPQQPEPEPPAGFEDDDPATVFGGEAERAS